jgi:DNA-binding transcriptional ArsR family regulator
MVMIEQDYRAARLLKILGNPLRYKICRALLRAPRTPSELALLVRRPLPAVSRDLTLLNLAGLVRYHSYGHGVLYHPKHPDELEALLQLVERFVRQFELPAPEAWREVSYAI